MHCLTAIITEILRVRPTVYAVSQILDEEIILGGCKIPPNTVMNFQMAAMGEDAAHLDESSEFQPERLMRDQNENIRPFPPFLSVMVHEDALDVCLQSWRYIC